MKNILKAVLAIVSNFIIGEEHMKENGQESTVQTRENIETRIAEIDALISLQLNEIIRHDDFRKLEASWRGLHYLVREAEPDQHLKIKVLQVSKRELTKDFEKSIPTKRAYGFVFAPSDFAKSTLFKLVHDDVFGTVGAFPFGLLIGDYEFGSYPNDTALLRFMAGVGRLSQAPFISAVSPELFAMPTIFEAWMDDLDYDQNRKVFGYDSFEMKESNIQHMFMFLTYAKEYLFWRRFRESEISSYAGLCLPPILLREPYDGGSSELFDFRETPDPGYPEKLFFGNAAYAFGACVAKAYRESGWCGTMSGPRCDGLVTGLPGLDEGFFARVGKEFPGRSEGLEDRELYSAPGQSVQILIGKDRMHRFAWHGLIPLIQDLKTNETAFFSDQSCRKPPRYAGDHSVYEKAGLTTRISSVLAISRFAHYLKVLVRDRQRLFADQKECEQELRRWLEKYYCPIGEIDDQRRIEYPLSDFSISVGEIPDSPGEFKATAFLRPAYRLEELPISLEIEIYLPKTFITNRSSD